MAGDKNTGSARAPSHESLELDSDIRIEIDLESALDHQRDTGLLVGVLHIDVGAGAMDQVHGPRAARAVLREIARRLERALRTTDIHAHVRFGQFIVVLPGLGTKGDLLVVAEGVHRALSIPYLSAAAMPIEISTHIGGAVTATTRRDVKSLLRTAALACNEARRREAPIHVTHSFFMSLTRLLRTSRARSRRGDKRAWTGTRTSRDERALS